ncbi:MAG TPA: nucleotidyltransferase domain-containing protein [Candidatus Stackebrandtia excrementipullorum]|nr:nucleotidyltransferase domain-containing protein [Candidatus Stackebrandtia excrementipullorum]
MVTPDELITEHTILSVVVGSRAYGLSTADSDVDLRGVYAAPSSAWWGFSKPPTHVEDPGGDRLYWELERFLELALQGSPTVLECLWSPIVEYSDPLGDELLGLRSQLLSRRVYQSFLGYANSQFDRLASPVSARDWKRAMHMVRSLISVRHTLTTGELLIDVGAWRQQLLTIRRGEADWGSVRAWRDKLAQQAEEAYSTTRLPARANRAAAERFLIEVRRTRL